MAARRIAPSSLRCRGRSEQSLRFRNRLVPRAKGSAKLADPKQRSGPSGRVSSAPEASKNRRVPVDHRACSCMGDLVIGGHGFQHDATQFETVEGVGLRHSPSDGPWQALSDEIRWNIGRVHEHGKEGPRRDDVWCTPLYGASHRPRPHFFWAPSQCSAILPFSIRNMSNQVVVYFLVGSDGSTTSRTKLRTT